MYLIPSEGLNQWADVRTGALSFQHKTVALLKVNRAHIQYRAGSVFISQGFVINGSLEWPCGPQKNPY